MMTENGDVVYGCFSTNICCHKLHVDQLVDHTFDGWEYGTYMESYKSRDDGLDRH